MTTKWTNPRRRRGASITELLTVTAAVSVPAALLGGVGMKVYGMATDAAMVREVRALQAGCEQFHERFGAYPPDMHDPAAVERFMRHAFPKCPPKRYPKPGRYSPASALPLWLGGIDGLGLSGNPENPFERSAKRLPPPLEFDLKRLVPNAKGALEYYPPGGTAGSPYVYFRPEATNARSVPSAAKKVTAAKKGSKNAKKSGRPCQSMGYEGNRGWPPVKPYINSDNGQWVNAQSFQILCPGQDGKYGVGNHFPKGNDYNEANLDDIANFSRGARLQRAMP